MTTTTRTLTPILAAALMGCIFLASSSQVHALVGQCSNCHVMHASEVSTGGSATTPNDTLLRSTCLGCHTEVAGSSAGPAVLDAGTDLAGGDFAYSELDLNKGHNPSELTNPDNLTSPPGWKNGFTDSVGNQVGSGAADGGWAADKLTCAGNYGCHGNHSIANSTSAMQGSHHVNATGAVSPASGAGATVGGSFRFLHGIKGYEDADWEETNSAADRNVYYGESRTGTGAAAGGDDISDKQTISYLCAQCHGIFHSGGGTNEGLLDDDTDVMGTDPWVRHPSDFLMPNTGEFVNYTTYLVTVPVASPVVQDAATHNGQIAAGAQRIVMCLSCHRAHASNFGAALRWDPTTILANANDANNGKGCFACHSSLDDGAI